MKNVADDTRDFRQEKNSAIESKAKNEKFPLWKQVIFFVVSLILAFFLGAILMSFSGREAVNKLQATEASLRMSRMQNHLATATLYTKRGEYERARALTSDFYTQLRAEIDRNDAAFTAEQRDRLQSVLSQRDEIVTLLARNDNAAVERLADLYMAYIEAINHQPQQSG